MLTEENIPGLPLSSSITSSGRDSDTKLMEDHFYIRLRDTVLVLCINICFMSLSLDVPVPFSTIGREGL